MAAIAARQDASWDLQNYHIYNAFALLHPARWHDFDFAQSQGFLNPILDVPLSVLDAAFPHGARVVAFCMGLPFGGLAFFTLRLAMRLFGGQPHAGWAAGIAVAIGLTGSATVSQIGLSSNEILVAAFVVAALDVLLAAPEKLSAIALAGLLAGLATGGKLTAAPYAVGIAAALLAALPPRRWAASLGVLVVTGLAGTLLTGGFWMLHLQELYGDPIFPYANQVFHSPWAGPYAYNDTRFFPHSRREALLYPFLWIHKNNFYVTEKPFADARLAAVLAMSTIGLAAGALRRPVLPPPAWRGFIVFWFVSYGLWEKLFSIYRYVIPLEITAGFLVVGALRVLAPHRPALTTAVAALLVLLIGRATIYPNWGRIPFQSQSIPLTLPPIVPGTLVIATDPNAVSFIATAAPQGVTFIGVNNNFVVPDTSLTWRRLAATIATWPGPMAIIEPAAGSPADEAYIAAVYNLAAAGPCRPISSALDRDAFALCPARRLPSPSPYQPDLSFNFAAGGNAGGIIGTGWAAPEDWGRWNNQADAELVLHINPACRRPIDLIVLAYANVVGQNTSRVAVFANGHLLTTWAVGGDPVLYRAVIPAPAGDGRLTLDFHAAGALGIGILGMNLQEVLR